MSTKIRRTVFAALLLLLAVQGYIVSDVGEPYPAVWAPGFPGGKASTTYVKPSITFVYRDGAQHTISQDQLLEQFPNSHHAALMTFFRPLSDDAPPATRKLYLLFPGYRKGHRERRTNRPHAWRWFDAQSQRLFDRNDLESIHVDWNVHRMADHQFLEQLGTYEVSHADA